MLACIYIYVCYLRSRLHSILYNYIGVKTTIYPTIFHYYLYDISYKYSVYYTFYLIPYLLYSTNSVRRLIVFFTIKSNFDTVRVSDNDKKNCVFFYVQYNVRHHVCATYKHAHARIQT